MTGDVVVQHGLKCDMDSPFGDFQVQTLTYASRGTCNGCAGGVVDLRCSPGSKGSSCRLEFGANGKKGKNKAE